VPKLARIAAIVVIALTVVVLLPTTALRFVTHDWIVSFEYDHGRVPADRHGLTKDERHELALDGLDSIRPRGPGVALLVEARLPNGEPAFTARELSHMQDVHDAVAIAFWVQLVALLALVAAALALVWRPAGRRTLLRGLQAGGAAMLGIAAVLGALMLLAWDRFFVWFHELFFTGDTWQFRSTDTLLRLYPDEFWIGVAAWISAITVVWALGILGVSTVLLRRVR
jgi:integral membrane protein (TIGR01906 family)